MSKVLPESVKDDEEVVRYINTNEDDILVFNARKGQNKFFLKYSPVLREENLKSYIQIGKDTDVDAPFISITSHANNEVIENSKSNKIIIQGTITDTNGVRAVIVNGDVVSLVNQVFSKEITLANGVNNIKVEAYDKSGNVSAKSINLIYTDFSQPLPLDIKTPEITIISPSQNTTIYKQYVGIVVELDDSLIKNIKIISQDGQEFEIGHIKGKFSSNIPLISGVNLITIEAKDENGNISHEFLSVNKAGTTSEIDSNEPIIKIISHSDNQTVSTSSINLIGSVNDPEVVFVSINSVDTKVIGGNWSRVIYLDIGENMIEIVAEDIAGNIGGLSLTIIYKE